MFSKVVKVEFMRSTLVIKSLMLWVSLGILVVAASMKADQDLKTLGSSVKDKKTKTLIIDRHSVNSTM